MIGFLGSAARFAGLKGLRLLQLNVLWIIGTLCGGVVLGIGPSTAAVAAVLRHDELWGIDAEWGRRQPVIQEFIAAWRREFWAANRLAAVLGAAWALILVELVLLRAAPVDAWSSASRGLLIALAVWLGACGTLAWSLQAHFADSTAGILKRTIVFAIGRPQWALAQLASVGAILALYFWIPGLAVVFGVGLPCAASLFVLGVSRTLPQPEGARAPRDLRAKVAE